MAETQALSSGSTFAVKLAAETINDTVLEFNIKSRRSPIVTFRLRFLFAVPRSSKQGRKPDRQIQQMDSCFAD